VQQQGRRTPRRPEGSRFHGTPCAPLELRRRARAASAPRLRWNHVRRGIGFRSGRGAGPPKRARQTPWPSTRLCGPGPARRWPRTGPRRTGRRWKKTFRAAYQQRPPDHAQHDLGPRPDRRRPTRRQQVFRSMRTQSAKIRLPRLGWRLGRGRSMSRGCCRRRRGQQGQGGRASPRRGQRSCPGTGRRGTHVAQSNGSAGRARAAPGRRVSARSGAARRASNPAKGALPAALSAGSIGGQPGRTEAAMRRKSMAGHRTRPGWAARSRSTSPGPRPGAAASTADVNGGTVSANWAVVEIPALVGHTGRPERIKRGLARSSGMGCLRSTA